LFWGGCLSIRASPTRAVGPFLIHDVVPATVTPQGDVVDLAGWSAGRERHGVEPDQGPEQRDEVVLAVVDMLADPTLELGGRDYGCALG
jgi:hypothetical protein